MTDTLVIRNNAKLYNRCVIKEKIIVENNADIPLVWARGECKTEGDKRIYTIRKRADEDILNIAGDAKIFNTLGRNLVVWDCEKETCNFYINFSDIKLKHFIWFNGFNRILIYNIKTRRLCIL